MHKLLARQLRRAFGSPEAAPPEVAAFIATVDEAYRRADEDRAMLERSLDLSSQELFERSRRAEAKSLGLLQAHPDLVLYIDAADVVLDCRTPWPDAFTAPAIACIGKPVATVLAADGALGEWLAEALVDARTSGAVQLREFRDHWKDGPVLDLEMRVSPLEQGEALAIVRDITERMNDERALQESQERLELAILGSADGLWDWTPATGTVTFTSRLRELLGVDEAQFPDRVEAFDAALHPDDRTRVWNAVGAHFQQQVPYNEIARLRHGSGEYRWFQLRGQAVWDDAGEAIRMAGSIRDVSDLKAKERELERARDAAEAASRAKDEFLANMSHEIRTPMNALLGLTQLLLEGELRPRERGYATSALDAGRSLLSLINDLLDISRIEARELVLEPIDFSLATTVRETFRLFEPKARAKGLAISLVLDPALPRRVTGDPGRLRQILMSLLGNAVKFTPQGGITLTVSPGEGDRVRFAVSDTGIGIPEERLSDVLEKFTQVDGASTRRHGGTGLGLAISRHLAQLMGGEIDVESRLGEGSRFTLAVPLAAAAAPERHPFEAMRLAGVRALVVNDDPESAARLCQEIESLGVEVEGAPTLAGALTLLRAAARAGRPFEICVVNDRSSDLQSDAMARVIKRDPLLRDVVMVIMVTLGMPGDARRLYDGGFTAYLAPPLHPDDVRDAVATAWRLERVEKARALVTRHSLAEARARDEAASAGSRPAAPELQLQAAAPADATPATSGAPASPLCLVVDDNDINRHVANEMLRRMGCRVVLVEGGAEAVAAAESQPFDVIFMDVQMPGMDGFEATARIRARQQVTGRRVPIIAVTANAMRGDRQRCLDAGMDDYLAKPITRAGLHDMVQRWAAPAPTAARAASATPTALPSSAPPATPLGAPLVVTAAAPLPPPPVAHVPAPPGDVLDLAQLRSIVGDDPARIAEFVAMFIALTAPLVDEFVRAVRAGDLEAVRRSAHKLKGSCGSAGARELSAIGARAERSAQDGDRAALDRCADAIAPALDRVRALLPADAPEPATAGASAGAIQGATTTESA